MTTEQTDSYARQVSSQDAMFENMDNIHDLPPISFYWSERHLRPRVEAVLGAAGPYDFYARCFQEAQRRTGRRRVLSVGSGDATQEILVMQRLIELGDDDIEIECLELAAGLVERARASIGAAGLDHRMSVVRLDLNRGFPTGPLAAVMAHHALHHIVELEDLFESIVAAISPSGLFVTVDMIGRNGHMRWPEVLAPLRQLWSALPPRLRVDRILGHEDPWFENPDCSVEGFEGVRAQEILPLLSRYFYFERFLAYGGLLDPFLDRVYGPNLDVDDPDDRLLVERLSEAQDSLLTAGQMTPTQMWAVLAVAPPEQPTVCWGNLTPLRCVRDPAALAAPIELARTGFESPYGVTGHQPAPAPEVALGVPLELDDAGPSPLRWGWSAPGPGPVWGVGEESAVVVRTPRREPGGPVRLTFTTTGYTTPERPRQRIEVTVNGAFCGVLDHADAGPVDTAIVVADALIDDERQELEILLRPSYWRRPDLESGEDRRALSVALHSLRLDPG